MTTKPGDKIRVCTNARYGYWPRISREDMTVIVASPEGVIYRNKNGQPSLARSWVRCHA